MSGFRFLPHSVTSDVAFEAFGETYEELFINAGTALFSVMADLNKVKTPEKRLLTIKADTIENLLFSFLNELLFLKDRDAILFSKFSIHYDTRKYRSKLAISAKIEGEKIDPNKHKLGVDVKAVTKHNFKIEKEQGKYKATVVLDI